MPALPGNTPATRAARIILDRRFPFLSLARARRTLLVLAVLVVLCETFDGPVALTLLLALIGAAIPFAVALLGGADMVRARFLMPPRRIDPQQKG
ncbi:hypothetical protein [Nonomuraea maritima]|uniref:hypothetical protein n=1 Tax=Nonomuraea maritima TaxID=683260 RepID=UPI00370FD4BC